MSITVSTDRRLIRASGATVRHLLIELTVPPAPPRDAAAPRPPVSLALVLDRSGSMVGEKIRLVREAAGQAIRSLAPTDQFAVVIYDSEITCLAPLAAATEQQKQHVLQLLEGVEARATTNLSGGWFSGVDQLRTEEPTGVRRCLLLTDGLANGGMTDPEQLAACAEQFRGQGIVTSTFGVGEDFDEHLLRGIARNGGGNFYFIEHAAQIPELLAGEVGDALDVVMPEAVLQVRVPAATAVRAVDGRRMVPKAEGWRLSIGDLVTAQEYSVVLAVEFSNGTLGERVSADVQVRAANGASLVAPQPVVWTRASAADLERQPRDLATDRATAQGYASQARVAATRYNRDGQLAEAGRVLERTGERILAYAGGDVQMSQLAGELRVEAEAYRRERRSPMELKQAMFAAHAVGESRDEYGRPRRRR